MKLKSLAFFRLSAVLCSLLALGIIIFSTLPPPGTIPVLMYHFVGDPAANPESEGNFVSPEALERQMAFLKKFRYRVLTLDAYYATLKGARKSEGREVVITFDDGDHSFSEKAVPILAKYQFPVTVFLISDLIKTGENGSMTLDTVLQLKKNYSWLNFQGHTKTHAHLKEITDAQLKEEMETSKQDLFKMLGTPIRDLAYPYGEFDLRTLAAVKQAGYRMAFTTTHKKLNHNKEGFLSLTRIKMSRTADREIGFWYLLSGTYQWIKGTREKMKNGFRA